MLQQEGSTSLPNSASVHEGNLRHGVSKSKIPTSGYESGEGDNIRVYVRVRPPDKHLETEVDRTPCLEEEVFGAVGKKIVEGSEPNCAEALTWPDGFWEDVHHAWACRGEEESFTHQLRGVIPRAFEYLFSLINREQEKHGERLEFLCRCSFLEIYNEQIFDLLDPASIGLSLREDIKKGVFVDGLLERDVASARDAYRVLNSGWLNRRVASTSMNRESSRSHAVFYDDSRI
ncbi:Kinesin-like protein kif15 [Desmophyllum pertusum]|uniref:Kinesin-like protein kif15 n=1 Tax=Desmophyllum pertusum TaxID=174260 RepID=A0A9X0CSQ7_9CNID|nr:Kinesin-like protein kif15 [Desmophyllum pertusum]